MFSPQRTQRTQREFLLKNVRRKISFALFAFFAVKNTCARDHGPPNHFSTVARSAWAVRQAWNSARAAAAFGMPRA
jgi:hypothetical protein